MSELFDRAMASADLAQIDETARLRAEVKRLAAALHASELARLAAEIDNAHLERQNQWLLALALNPPGYSPYHYTISYHSTKPILEPGDACFGPPI
jgi:hypothetical protein